MSLARHAKRRDIAEAPIVEGLRALGWNNVPHQIDYKGQVLSMKELAVAVGISYQTIATRWAKGERGERLWRPIRKDMHENGIDLRGLRFGRLVVLSRAGSRFGALTWNCRCDCGNDVVRNAKYLRHRRTDVEPSCGCALRKSVASICGGCGQQFLARWRGVKRGYQKACSKACSFIVRDVRGAKNPNWKDNATERNLGGRFTAAYQKWRKAVFERDGHKCTSCDSTEDLQADHIEPWALYPESRFNVDNGQTLCKWCHLRKTQAEWRVRARKRDISEPAIVHGLRRLGYKVYLLHEPCDILVFHPRWGNFFRTLEVKTPHGKKVPKAKLDKRQVDQQEFLATTGTPVVTSLEEALEALK